MRPSDPTRHLKEAPHPLAVALCGIRFFPPPSLCSLEAGLIGGLKGAKGGLKGGFKGAFEGGFHTGCEVYVPALPRVNHGAQTPHHPSAANPKP